MRRKAYHKLYPTKYYCIPATAVPVTTTEVLEGRLVEKQQHYGEVDPALQYAPMRYTSAYILSRKY